MPKPKTVQGQIEPGRKYVGAKKAAEIGGFNRVRVIQLLKEGKYPGAFRNSSGYWVIPLEEAEAAKRQKAEWEWGKTKIKKQNEKARTTPQDLASIASKPRREKSSSPEEGGGGKPGSEAPLLSSKKARRLALQTN